MPTRMLSLHSGGALDLTPLRGLQISHAETFFLCAQNAEFILSLSKGFERRFNLALNALRFEPRFNLALNTLRFERVGVLRAFFFCRSKRLHR